MKVVDPFGIVECNDETIFYKNDTSKSPLKIN